MAFCDQAEFQNGDLDYDGLSYRPDWPNGSRNYPTTFRYVGPFTNGHTIRTSSSRQTPAGSEALCDVATGAGCTAPPTGAAFYPFWSLGKGGPLGCTWNFGNVIAGRTITSFGGDAQYGVPDVARFGGTLTSAVLANPQIGCPFDRPGRTVAGIYVRRRG